MDRRTKTKLALTLALVLPLAAVLIYFLQFRHELSVISPSVPESVGNAVMALSKVRQTATKDGIVQWKLQADTARMDAETGQMVLQSPEINFFLDDGSQVHLTAQKGVLDTRANDMQVQGNVHLSSDRYTLVTEALAYDHARRVITTEHSVRINGKTIQLNAAAMTYDLKTNQALFGGPVKGVLHENPVM